ncbi:heterokaryon incompatibility protein-domain-containing protein [Apodospora peruviana]|uniref:Heterokaryon incompatibility protein-domain-containing protein n=1 Tax=Apodospora peruviana TaxID=516989 RepID=A0AAE0HXA5_9PEZI|nr:heterokaryon incompatibility protein-domain-containing protein [Apodospora peruviana]
MRLIHTTTLQLHEFVGSAIPPYAILSHTWQDDEVSFQDMMSSPDVVMKPGYDKIFQTCRLAREQHIEFAWVDTCCIDKASSAELTESINSMFAWYKKAVVCYAYLADLHSTSLALDLCSWFTRGWTLQELLAPNRMYFYNMDWEHVGSKYDLASRITGTTGIPKPVILGQVTLDSCSVAMRMSWAANRETTRVEDMAYSLLGIFGVHMPLIYGEGTAAFRRLQEEIIKRNNDLTIFAWDHTPYALAEQQTEQTVLPLLAKSPKAFSQSWLVVPFTDDFAEFSLTNKGLASNVMLRIIHANHSYPAASSDTLIYSLWLGSGVNQVPVGIGLRKIGPGFFHRDLRCPPMTTDKPIPEVDQIENPSNYHILVDPPIHPTRLPFSNFRKNAIHVPRHPSFELLKVSPEHLWDVTDRVFLRPHPFEFSRYPMALAMQFRFDFRGLDYIFVVLCSYSSRDPKPTCVITDDPIMEDTIFNDRNRQMSLSFQDLITQRHAIGSLSSHLKVNDWGAYRVFVSMREDEYDISDPDTGPETRIRMFGVDLTLKSLA